MKVLIVGGVAGGASAAARLRRLDERAEIIVFERSEYVSYANCGLPYFIGGEITEKEYLSVQTPTSLGERFNLDVRVRNEVLSVDPANKSVRVRNLEDELTYQESYDALVISTGARPMKLDIPGIDDPRVFTLRDIPDTYRIHEYVENASPKSAVVIGGGFIGMQMTENLKNAGLDVTVIEYSEHVIAPLDGDMAAEVHHYLKTCDVDLHLHTSVKNITSSSSGLELTLDGGKTIETNMVILAVGVQADTAFIAGSGIACTMRGAILTDEHMRTNFPDIYAVGDAVAVKDPYTEATTYVTLAGPANKQGRIAADNIAGLNTEYNGSQGSAILKLFDRTIASTGLNEKRAKAEGIDYEVVYTHSPSHATYYPGANYMTIKTLFDLQNGRVLGAQIVGFDGVDKRIDVLATAVRAGLTAQDLAELELCYAPPFSSARDPVNVAGFMMENILEGLVKQYHWHDVPSLMGRDEIAMLDVRPENLFARGSIPGAKNIPLAQLRSRLNEIDKAKPLYINCQIGLTSYIACRMLSQYGFECYNLAGGYRLYESVIADSYDFAKRMKPFITAAAQSGNMA